MRYIKAVAAFGLAFCVTSNAFAETFRSNARSGAKVTVLSHWIYNNQCHSSNFAKVSFRQPANGTLSYVKKKVRVPKGKKCAGKLSNGVEVYYRSKPGFRGQDRGRAYFTFDGGRNQSTNNARFVINVK